MSTKGPQQDILKRFPYEIWSRCILDAIYRAPEGPLPFMGVSSHWQKTLISSPEMWSYIDIDDEEDVDARIHTFLTLSGRYPLEVAIAFTKPIWDRMKPIISSHKERINSIYVLTWPQTRRGDEIVPTLLEGIDFPALRTIETVDCSFGAPTFEHVLALCPNLEYSGISIVSSSNEGIKGLPEGLQQVQITTTNTPMELMVTQIQPYLRLPHLKYLNISVYVPPDTSLEILTAVLPNNFALSSTELRQLTLFTNILPIIRGILGSPLIYLQSLVTVIYPHHFDSMISAFPSLPSLKSIWLAIIFNGANPNRFSRLQQSHIPHLETFTFYVNSGSQTSLKEIFDALTEHDALVGLENFKLDRPDSGESVYVVEIAKLLYSLRNCAVIDLPALNDDPTAERGCSIVFPIHMPNLLSFIITYSTPIPPITAPLLLSLTTSFSATPYRLNHFGQALEGSGITGEGYQTPLLSPFNHWDTVQRIQWASCESFIGSKTIRFQHIRSVEFDLITSQDYDYAHALNTFLVSLLRYPDACPHLHTVKSAVFPIWRLLSQVLVLRNGNSSLDRLQEIWFLHLPTRPLLAIVVALLNDERSMLIPESVDNIILHRFQHEVVTACHYCITSGYTQCLDYSNISRDNLFKRWWHLKEDGTMHDRRSDADYLELLELLSNSPTPPTQDLDPELSWKDWEDRLKHMTANCKGILGSGGCRRYGRWKRIHRYM